MDLGFSLGLMVKCTEDNTKMTINMVMGSLSGPTEKDMKVCGGKESSMEKE